MAKKVNHLEWKSFKVPYPDNEGQGIWKAENLHWEEKSRIKAVKDLSWKVVIARFPFEYPTHTLFVESVPTRYSINDEEFRGLVLLQKTQPVSLGLVERTGNYYWYYKDCFYSCDISLSLAEVVSNIDDQTRWKVLFVGDAKTDLSIDRETYSEMYVRQVTDPVALTKFDGRYFWWYMDLYFHDRVNRGKADIKTRVDNRLVAYAMHVRGVRLDYWFDNQTFRDMFSRQRIEPIVLFHYDRKYYWWYQDSFYSDDDNLSTAEVKALIDDQKQRKKKKIERILRINEARETLSNGEFSPRKPIPQDVQMFVWQRDGGKCVNCGSKLNLEYDHIIPISQGGSNTARNIQLLCENCNRSKGGRIGG